MQTDVLQAELLLEVTHGEQSLRARTSEHQPQRAVLCHLERSPPVSIADLSMRQKHGVNQKKSGRIFRHLKHIRTSAQYTGNRNRLAASGRSKMQKCSCRQMVAGRAVVTASFARHRIRPARQKDLAALLRHLLRIHCEVQRRRAALVLYARVCTARQQRLQRLDISVERCDVRGSLANLRKQARKDGARRIGVVSTCSAVYFTAIGLWQGVPAERHKE